MAGKMSVAVLSTRLLVGTPTAQRDVGLCLSVYYIHDKKRFIINKSVICNLINYH